MDKIKVNIKNEQDIFKPDVNKMKEITRYVLEKEGCKETEVSILLTEDDRIRQLNKRYRNTDETTDVLAFYQQKNKKEALRYNLLGDVVISTETAKRQAKEYNQPLLKEFYLYLIHGLLHLLNYKDETSQDYQNIKEKQEQLLKEVWKKEN